MDHRAVLGWLHILREREREGEGGRERGREGEREGGREGEREWERGRGIVKEGGS